MTTFSPTILESESLRLEVLPDLGGRIWSVVHKPSGKQWLWHNPEAQSLKVGPGREYDSNWIGGWDDLFPNDAPGVWQGMTLPDHGELWSSAWRLSNASRRALTLVFDGQSFPYRLSKTITMDGAAGFRVEYTLENLSEKTLDLLLKLHPAFAVQPGDVLELPGGVVEPVDVGFSSIVGSATPSSWPMVEARDGKRHDLSVIPPESHSHQEFVYLRELPAGWFAIRDKAGRRFEMTYPREIFPFFWIFMDLGKWRGFRVVVMEPCTNYPKDMAQAALRRCCLHLTARQRLTFSVGVRTQ